MTIDIEDFALYLISTLSNVRGDPTGDLEDLLLENFGIDFYQLRLLVDKLLPSIMVAEDFLAGTNYKGFADTKDQRWLAKVEIDNV